MAVPPDYSRFRVPSQDEAIVDPYYMEEEEKAARGNNQGGMDPLQAYQTYQQYAGGSTAAPAAGGETAAGSEAIAGGGEGLLSSASALWPAAVVIAAIARETSARNNSWNYTDSGGDEHKLHMRPGDNKDQLRDIATGRVLHYDMERQINPKLNSLTGGNSKGDPGLWQNSGAAASSQLMADLGSPWSWDDIGRSDLNNTTVGRAYSKLKDLF